MSALPGPGTLKGPVGGLTCGQTVGAGRYLLRKVLGQGGMAVVWLAEDRLLREAVALKFLPPQICFDPAGMEGLRQETLRTRKLSHPNIIRVHDLHDLPDEPVFFSMEYVDGSNLHTLRANRPEKVLTWGFLAPLVQQLAQALEYAHGERVIHRDLKPGNLMLDSNGRLKLSDFGLAGIVTDSMSRLSDASHTSGTIGYMSPQQADGRKPRATDDIYALGVTLYELLTSTPPFHSGDIGYQVRHVAPEPMAQRLADLELSNSIPPTIESMVMACLAKEPEQRPQSAKAILDWLDGTETRVIPRPADLTVPIQPGGSSASLRTKLVRAGAIFLLLSGLAGAGVFLASKTLGPQRTDHPPANPQEKFEILFNGRDLAGWDGDPALWSVKDGAITASSAAEGVTRRENTCLIWRENVSDFELRLQFRTGDVITEKPANSGVLYRSRRVPNPDHNWQVRGYQADLHGAFTGTLILLEDSTRDLRTEWGRSTILTEGSDQIILKPGERTTTDELKNVMKAGGWNELVITAKGNRFTHRINGVTTMEAIDEAGGPRSGYLALELKRATQVQFKDIRLRRLTP